MTRADKAERIQTILDELYPETPIPLAHQDPFTLLVAVVLSAQCTDKRVNLVTPELFRRWPTPAALAKAPIAAIEKVIKSTGFFRNKAKSLRGLAHALVEQHGGEVPRDMNALVKLPGIGRKTANVILGNAFGLNAGIVVDTHVQRLATKGGLAPAGGCTEGAQTSVPYEALYTFSVPAR